MTLGEAWSCAERLDEGAWLHLPAARPWTVATEVHVLRSEEVPPEEEDEPDAGVPQLAKDLGLRRVLAVSTVQEIVVNAREQAPAVTPAQLLAAFHDYFEHDAFIEL